MFSIVLFSNPISFLEPYSADYDLVIMDIQMPHIEGIETAHAIREKNSDICIVFVTNFAEHAIKDYEVQTFDYLLKPVLCGNFCICMEKIFCVQYAKEKRMS